VLISGVIIPVAFGLSLLAFGLSQVDKPVADLPGKGLEMGSRPPLFKKTKNKEDGRKAGRQANSHPPFSLPP